jgi:hypothetical protein
LQTLRQILAEQLAQVHTHLGLALRATADSAEDQSSSEVEAGSAVSADASPAADREAEGDREQTQQSEQSEPPPTTATG